MGKIAQDIKLEMTKKAGSVVSRATAIRLSRALQKVVTALILQRIEDGYDILSRKFGGYNKSYNKKLAFKYAAKKYGTTKYASKSNSDKLALTGNLKSSIYTRTIQINQSKNLVNMKLKVDVKGLKNMKKAEGLQSAFGVARNRKRYAKKEWLFLGLATSGSYKVKERKAIMNFVSKFLTKITKTKVFAK